MEVMVMFKVIKKNDFFSIFLKDNPLDKQYIEHLVNLTRQNLGDDVLLYTTDGGGLMHRGSLEGSSVLSLGIF